MNYGDETVVAIEIDQPLCAHQFGVSPCTAALGPGTPRKCYNTRSTCADIPNYAPGVLTLRFVRPQQAISQYGWVLPCLDGVTTTPSRLNLGGIRDDGAPFGQREVVTIEMADFLHSDLAVDPYRLERASGAAAADGSTFDPYTRGSFWSKWLARNPYYANYALRVLTGVLGDAFSELNTRHYYIDSIEGPVDGAVRIVAKDLFSRVEARKAVAPRASQGQLHADLTGSPATFQVDPAGIGDLPASQGGYADITASVHGNVAIGDEIIEVTRVGDVFTVVTRGVFNTTAGDHKTEDLVQTVLSYVSQKVQDILYDLLVNYTDGVDRTAIDKAAWDINAATLTTLYTAHIAKPVAIETLVSELEVQAGCTVWPNVSTGMIELAALRASAPDATVDDRSWIIDGSLALKRRGDLRVSQVWVYYAQINPLVDLDQTKNYRSRLVDIDIDAESDQQYGVPGIRTVFSRWIPQFGRSAASATAARILAMFRDPPYEVEFKESASRSGQIELGRYFVLKVAEIQDETGAVEPITLAAIQVAQGENEDDILGQQIAFVPQDPTSERVINIENDVRDLNLRSIHDTQFAAPTGTEHVRFIVDATTQVGSSFYNAPAIDTGDWPAGQPLFLDIKVGARVEGAGAPGGRGGERASSYVGYDGIVGGDAIVVRVPITIDNLGQIWGGGGGGGGGGARHHTFSLDAVQAGSGGGGGAGNLPGAGGAKGTNETITGPLPTDGFQGSTEAGGEGGDPWAATQGKGGRGGDPGQAGQNGAAALTDGAGGTVVGAGGLGAQPGRYVVNNFLVTWVNTGDRRGNVT